MRKKIYDLFGMGNTLVDSEYQISDENLKHIGIPRGQMTLVDKKQIHNMVCFLSNCKSSPKHRIGGSACNTLASASGFGLKTFFSHNTGNDSIGVHFKRDVQKQNIAIDPERGSMKGRTGNCLVMVTPDGQRTMATNLGVSSNFSSAHVNQKALSNSRMLYIEGYLTSSKKATKAIHKAATFARLNKIPIALTLSDVLIIESYRERLEEITNEKVDMIFCNANEAKAWTKSKTICDAKQKLEKTCLKWVMTLGENGAVINSGKNVFSVSSPRVNAIDTNGAGDLFAGSFLYGILTGMTHENSGKLATLATSRLVTIFGNKLPVNEYRKIKSAFQKQENINFAKKNYSQN